MSEPTAAPYMPRAARDDWGTPTVFFLHLMMEFGFTVDAAASDANHLLEKYWTKETDGLAQDWYRQHVYVNPPWDHKSLKAWTAKAWEESRALGTVVVMLVPVKSDQSWWHDYAIRAEVRFIRGRITFKGAESSYPGDCALLIFSLDHGPRMVSMARPRKEDG
ncbi:MAG: adenine methyltransferase [bacterium]|nr:adenine methyltransferase [bacterium]